LFLLPVTAITITTFYTGKSSSVSTRYTILISEIYCIPDVFVWG
jgi:hypothetical protein